MNLSAKTPRRNEAKRKPVALHNSSVLPATFKVFIFLLAIFVTVTARVSYNQKAESLNRESLRVREKIHRLEREIANLRIEKEKLSSWPHISDKLVALNLPLRTPDPQQVKRLIMIAKDGGIQAPASTPARKSISKRETSKLRNL
ncbi:MAG: hypothetical protein A2X49_13090 [Lentisphaerae bacterium GWF2_52_8]|nr:MAG: hypothetical protein A2X49_13090 [Lentisphaerae bacterium GWF2_52_8]